MQFRTLLLFFLLGAVITLVLFMNRPDEEKSSQAEAFKHNFYLQDFTLTRFDSDGQLKHKMKGQKIEQDVVSGESYITLPQAEFFSNGKANWKITAQKGWMDKNQSLARLENDVVLQQLINPNTRVVTTEIDLNLNEKIAENQVPVHITQASNKLEGTGLLARLDQNWLKLKAEVRGTYVP